MSNYQLRCPRCWERPSGEHYCECCPRPFNTFDTKGECPTCGMQYEKTQCNACKEWSEMTLWYQHIRCPNCQRVPSSQDQWECDKCCFIWHTFDTRGQCPDCKHQSQNTDCVSCGVNSPHLDWYEGH